MKWLNCGKFNLLHFGINSSEGIKVLSEYSLWEIVYIFCKKILLMYLTVYISLSLAYKLYRGVSKN